MRVLKFIYKNLDHFRKKFFTIFFIGIFDGAVGFLIPVFLAEFTKNNFSTSKLPKLFAYILLCYIASLLFQWSIRKYGESLSAHFANHIRLKYFKRLESLPVKNLISNHSGYLLSLINKVSDGLTSIITGIFWSLSHGIATLVLFFIFSARESFGIAVFNLFILIIFIFISFFLSKDIIPIADKVNTKRASLLGSYVDFMVNILTIKKLSIYSFAEKRLVSKTIDNDNQTQKLQNFHANRWFILHSIYGFAFLSTIGFLLYRVAIGKSSLAILIFFIAAYSMIKKNIQRLSEKFKSLLEMEAYVNKLDQILTLDSEGEKGEPKNDWQKIEFTDVFFEYLESKKKINIPKFNISKNEKIFIFGKSGEGKTTFLNLLANFFTEVKGTRIVDQTPYNEVEKKFFNSQIVMISQEVELFNISLRDNIILGQNIEENKVEKILEEMDLLSWVKSLPNGLDTQVGEKGIKLSAGQKQRVNLIRGILLNRDIYLFDEPTSHLDTANEERIIKVLDKYLKNKTVIIVSHREVLKKICNRFYAMKDHVLSEIAYK